MLTILLFVFGLLKSNCNDFGELCQSCTPFSCQYCANGYVNSDGMCVYVPKELQNVQNCFLFKNRNTCIQYEYGYYTNYDGKCMKMNDKECAIGSKDNCDYYFGNLARFGKNIKKPCNINNCRFCSDFRNLESCYLCNTGYVLIRAKGKTRCEKAVGKLIGCVQTDDYTSCELCDYFYVKVGMFCVESDKAGNLFETNHIEVFFSLAIYLLSLVI